MSHVDLQKAIRTGKTAGAEIKLHREHAIGYLHDRVGDRVRRTLQCSGADSCRVVKLELHVICAGRRRAAIGQAALISESCCVGKCSDCTDEKNKARHAEKSFGKSTQGISHW